MPKLPCLTGAEMIRVLEQRGFVVVRIRGSHHVMAKEELRTVVPVHGNQDLRTAHYAGFSRTSK